MVCAGRAAGADDAARQSMSRLTAFGLTALVVLTTACARQTVAGASTTAITSGSTPGGRMTSVRIEAAMRLADEICNREVACSQVGEGARYPTVETCMSDQGARAPAQLARWSCTPSAAQGSFETCLAAIRGEHCESRLSSVEELSACRSVAVCGR